MLYICTVGNVKILWLVLVTTKIHILKVHFDQQLVHWTCKFLRLCLLLRFSDEGPLFEMLDFVFSMSAVFLVFNRPLEIQKTKISMAMLEENKYNKQKKLKWYFLLKFNQYGCRDIIYIYPVYILMEI